MSRDYIFEPRPTFSAYTPNLFLGSYYIEDGFQADPTMWNDPLEDAFVTNVGMKEGKIDGTTYLNDFSAETILMGTKKLDELAVLPQSYFWKWVNYDGQLQIPTEMSDDDFESPAYERFMEAAVGYDSDNPYFLLVVDSFMDEGEDVDIWAEEADWNRMQTTELWWKLYDLWMENEGVDFLTTLAEEDYDWAVDNSYELHQIGYDLPPPDDDDYYWSMRQAESFGGEGDIVYSVHLEKLDGDTVWGGEYYLEDFKTEKGLLDEAEFDLNYAEPAWRKAIITKSQVGSGKTGSVVKTIPYEAESFSAENHIQKAFSEDKLEDGTPQWTFLYRCNDCGSLCVANDTGRMDESEFCSDGGEDHDMEIIEMNEDEEDWGDTDRWNFYHFQCDCGTWNVLREDDLQDYLDDDLEIECEGGECSSNAMELTWHPMSEAEVDEWMDTLVVDLSAESFEAPYTGAGSLMGISGDTDLSSFTPDELTKSSAIHGDFDTASLDYSGHQNIEVRAEDTGLKWKEIWIVELANEDGMKDAEFFRSQADALEYSDWVLKQDAGMIPRDYLDYINDGQLLTLAEAKERFVHEYMWDSDDDEGGSLQKPVMDYSTRWDGHGDPPEGYGAEYRSEEGDNEEWDGDPDDYDPQGFWENRFDGWLDDWITGDVDEYSIFKIYAVKNGIVWSEFDEVDAEYAETWYYNLTPTEREAEIYSTTDEDPLEHGSALGNVIDEIIEDISSSWDDQFMSEDDVEYYIHSPDEYFGPYYSLIDAEDGVERLVEHGIVILGITRGGTGRIVGKGWMESESFAANDPPSYRGLLLKPADHKGRAKICDAKGCRKIMKHWRRSWGIPYYFCDHHQAEIDDTYSAEDTGDPDELSPQEALKVCEAGGCVYLKDYTDQPDDYDSFDYPTEDPDDIRMWIEEGLFDGPNAVTILSDPRPIGGNISGFSGIGERFAAGNEGHWMTFGQVDYNWATDPDDIRLTDEEFWGIDEYIRNEIRWEIDANNIPGEGDIDWAADREDGIHEEFTISYYWGPVQTTGVNSAEGTGDSESDDFNCPLCGAEDSLFPVLIGDRDEGVYQCQEGEHIIQRDAGGWIQIF